MAENYSTINIIIWSDNLETSCKEASAILGNPVKEDSYLSADIQSHSVNIFLRGPECSTHFTPANGVTDCLVVSLKNADSKDLAENFIIGYDLIPTKVIASDLDLSEWATKLGITYTKEISPEYSTKLIKSCISVNNTLIQTFKAFDKNGDGAISSEELITVSKELGHELQTEEAKEIANCISEYNSTISFSKFKNWWIFGKKNFQQFRNLVDMEVGLNKLVKKGSSMIGDYLDKLEKEAELNSKKTTDYVGKSNIRPKEDFEHGAHIVMDGIVGDKAKEILNSMPSHLKSSPITYSLELRVGNEEIAQKTVESLNALKEMLTESNPAFNLQSSGIDVKLRYIGKVISADLYFTGQVAEIINKQLNEVFTLKKKNISFDMNFFVQIISGLKFNDLFTCTYEDLVKMLCKFKLQAHTEVVHIQAFAKFLTEMYYVSYKDKIPKQYLAFFQLIKLMGCFKKFTYDCEYDSNLLYKYITELAGLMSHNILGGESMDQINSEMGTQVISSFLAQGQQTAIGFIDGFKGGALPMIEPYKESVDAVDLDHITISLGIPRFTALYKVEFCLTGLTELVKGLLA
mmetsp:Transcript_34658/g.36018  ORF Transcript_34658/g.36018 Transcript_34658/m.36018 type:complete len:576 (-) Transcript_34658:33-1760(-)